MTPALDIIGQIIGTGIFCGVLAWAIVALLQELRRPVKPFSKGYWG